jgi:hypothetical protein
MLSTKKVDSKTVVIHCPGNIVSDMNGEKVMMSINNSKYYNLGEIGGRIWDLINKPISVDELVSCLISEYQVNRVDCEMQVSSFLESLLNEKLIQIKK